jgi:predicted DNA-binding protein (UPF0251 family)
VSDPSADCVCGRLPEGPGRFGIVSIGAALAEAEMWRLVCRDGLAPGEAALRMGLDPAHGRAVWRGLCELAGCQPSA